MSLLLTAAKKRDPKARRKSSSSSSSSLGLGTSPPASNAFHSVWYWKLNGVLTTLMYTKDSDEIWCNGYTLQTSDHNDASWGHIKEFTIVLDDKGSSHHGQLVCNQGGSSQLFVDGVNIHQHSG